MIHLSATLPLKLQKICKRYVIFMQEIFVLWQVNGRGGQNVGVFCEMWETWQVRVLSSIPQGIAGQDLEIQTPNLARGLIQFFINSKRKFQGCACAPNCQMLIDEISCPVISWNVGTFFCCVEVVFQVVMSARIQYSYSAFNRRLTDEHNALLHGYVIRMTKSKSALRTDILYHKLQIRLSMKTTIVLLNVCKDSWYVYAFTSGLGRLDMPIFVNI